MTDHRDAEKPQTPVQEGPKYRDIEDLVAWAFREQQVERFVATLRGGAVGPSPSPRSSTDMLSEMLVLGTRVDSSGAGAKWLGARCHDDAITIYDAVMTLPEDAWVEVIKCARSNLRPCWYPEGAGRWETPRDRTGRPKVLYRDPVRKRDPIGLAPPELVGIDPLLVEESRAVYRLWYVSLCELAEMVNPELVSFRARWPAASPDPWLDPVGNLYAS